MSQTNVDDIIKAIEELADQARDLLYRRLAEFDEAMWQREVQEAGKIAREAGIDQAMIDQTIHQRRYGVK